MSVALEVRYLAIEWLAEHVVSKVDVAPTPLAIEPLQEGGLSVETTIFKDDYPWIGIRLLAQDGEIVPTLVASSGQEAPLLSIKEPQSGPTWWVCSNGWDGQKRRHYSELRRSAGDYRIRIGDGELVIRNQLSDSGRADIQAYVDDFRSSLLWMILNDDAGATASGTEAGGGKELASCLEELEATSRRVLSAPAVSVREARLPTPVSKVRATAATFREFAQDPRARQLTGRVFGESADTPENRYLRHMIRLVVEWTGAWLTGASSRLTPLDELAASEIERAERSRTLRERSIDPEIFDRQTDDIASRLEALQSWKGAPAGRIGRHGRFPLRLEQRYGKKTAFFYRRVQDDEASSEEVAYRVVLLPEPVFEKVQAALHLCRVFTFEGQAQSSIEADSNGKSYRKLELHTVSSIIPQADVLEQRASKRRRLKAKGWMTSLSASEQQELRREAGIAERRAKRMLAKREEIGAIVDTLARTRGKLAEVERGLAALGVGHTDVFPSGMLFTSNSTYAASLSAFKKVAAIFANMGLDSSLLRGLGKIGILHASDIYEKWCLVKLCAILIEEFGFSAERGWIESLVASALSGARNAELVFSRSDVGIRVLVTYQYETQLGFRPDFLIQIIDSSDGGHRQHRCLGSLVLDAKFRSAWPKQGPQPTLDELVAAKSYASAGGRADVFILQPCRDTVRPAASPLGWGRHCDYGASRSHQKGWIHTGVGPSGTATTDHLKRLLAMALQKAIPKPVELPNGGGWKSRSVCIGCGHAHSTDSIQSKTTKAGLTSWLLDCRHCGVWTVRTHCYQCRRPLFKNGTQWTYHETLADQVTNVICPDCQSHFDPLLNEGDQRRERE